MRVEKSMGAIQEMLWEGPREVQAKSKRPIVSRGTRKRSHQRRILGERATPAQRRVWKWWMEGRYER
jgi:hypothetical protein